MIPSILHLSTCFHGTLFSFFFFFFCFLLLNIIYRLEIGRDLDVRQLFNQGIDPCKDTTKTLFIEYENRGHKGFLKIKDEGHGRLLKSIRLEAPHYGEGGVGGQRMRHNQQLVSPGVQLRSAAWGHPNYTGRGGHEASVDVTRQLQIRLDQNKGRVLHVGRGENLESLFGDPCRGTLVFFQRIFFGGYYPQNIELGPILPMYYSFFFFFFFFFFFLLFFYFFSTFFLLFFRCF